MTNPTPHPYAEILRAIADGKQIQWAIGKTNEEIARSWEDVDPTSAIQCLAQYMGRKEHHFRIKPETKTGWIGIAKGGGTWGVCKTKEELIKFLQDHNWLEACAAIIEITYTPGEGLDA